MLINLKPVTLFSLLGLTTFSSAQVVVNKLVGYATLNGGTSSSGTSVTVTSCSALRDALEGADYGIVRISGTISGCGTIDVASDKSIFGVSSSAVVTGVGFRIIEQSNVVIRNLYFKKPPPEQDAITIQASTNVWVDHCVFESDLDHDKDYYDGLIDITHGSDWITISWCKFLNHWKASLVGHDDENGDEDTGKLHVTFHHNYWNYINSRTPSYRFGTGHIYSSCYMNILESGINARMGARVKVEQCDFRNAINCIATNLYSPDVGFVDVSGNVFDSSSTTSITDYYYWTTPYSYYTTPASSVCSYLLSYAGVGVVITLP